MQKTILGLLVLISISLKAQVNSENYRLNASKTGQPIVVDGFLDDPAWTTADSIGNFIQNSPNDKYPATSQSRVVATYDDENLYFAGVCYENSTKAEVIQSLKRDFDFPVNENISIYFDPFNDYLNGFTFGLSAAGVQREGLITGGNDVATDWDNKWYSEIKKYENRWEFEIRIPFKSIRYNESNTEWNLLIIRQDLKNNERSTWPPVPQGFRASDMAFSGKLVFDQPLKKSGMNISFIPYLTGGVSKNQEENTEIDYIGNVGFDAKVAITPSLNLDLTVNPDFSQVEVDQQVTNLSRFEISFPERRQFFLENQDLFARAGFPQTRPFFSRRVGIARDTNDIAKQIRIQYGARLSGKIGNKLRVGLLNMNTKKEESAKLTGVEDIEGSYNLPSQNYTVATAEMQVFGRSAISATFVNRQAWNFDENDTTLSTTKYNRVLGLDYELKSTDGKWSGTYYYHRSFDENRKSEHDFSSGAFLGYNSRKFEARLFSVGTSSGYNAEVGFVPRKDVWEIGGQIEYKMYPKSSKINQHGLSFSPSFIYGIDLLDSVQFRQSKTDESISIQYDINFANTSGFFVGLNRIYQKLRENFDPSRTEGVELLEGSSFEWSSVSAGYETDQRKALSGGARFSYGEYYNGNRFNLGLKAAYRYQPFGSLSIRAEYNSIRLPEPYSDANFWLIGPKLELTFTDKLFFTTFVQFNDIDNNVGHNSRFQWRFKPASDLFVVYTENYISENGLVKNRALVLKLLYWFNV